ncbi:MAG: ABC transporter substrate-binding protein, partial [Planctomycetes bacterium]|nr:ABC transporter substrate-binding protein [Planctomycetota bacterium]
LIIAVVAGIWFSITHKNLESRKTIQFAIATWPGFATGFVGLEKGFFEDLPVKFLIMDDSQARHAAFQSDQVDIMISSADVFIQEYAQGIKGIIILVTDESFGGDGIVAKTEINKPSELLGKKIAFARATPSHFLLYKILEKAKINPDQIQAVVVDDPSYAGQAFLGGSVDAAVTWEPFLTQVKNSGKGHVLLTTLNYPGIIVDVLVAKESLAQDKETLNKIIRGWIKSVQYISEYQKESQNIIAQSLKILPEDAENMIAGLRFADLERNQQFLCSETDAPRLLSIIQDAGIFWQSQNIIKEVPNLTGLVSNSVCSAFSKQ